MGFLDMRTAIFCLLLINITCTVVIVSLWIQNRRRFAGTGLWAVHFALQATGVFLILLRGTVPEALSVMLANILMLTGILLGYMGLERFMAKKGPQLQNYLVLIVLSALLYYFTYVDPDTPARVVTFSVASLAISLQCVWLAIRRIGPYERSITLPIGLVYGAFGFMSIIRIIEHLALPDTQTDFFEPGSIDALFIVSYQVLLVLLAYSLAFMINKRLYRDLQTQEEKFSKAFHSSPYAIILSQMSDGRIIEVNAGFENLTGFTAREVQDKSTLDLNIWADAADRAAVVEEISKNSSLQGIELNFLKKSGEHVTGFFSAETITINNQTALLASISDITERKRTEERVKALLAEKELILIEVHHRVKNNLNAIYSLLNLQAAEHGDSSAAGALHDAAGRVRSMMMLYDKLYRSEIVTEISIDTYFPPLIDEIVGLFPGEAKPKVETAIDLIVLKAKTVSTLGIILNELITNAMKYAVRDRRDAALRLSAAGRDGTISISFEDNGPGIPESVTVENSSGFGMRLVDMLVKQMGGTVRIERHDGTRFIIKFRE